MEKKKNVILEWLKDDPLYYVWTKPKSIYNTIRHWFKCNFNKYHWRLLKQSWVSYPWDGSFLLYLEECQIDKQLHYFEHNQLMVDEEYNLIMRTLRIAKHCIHMMNNDCDLFHYDGESKFIPQKLIIDEEGNRRYVDAEEEVEPKLYRMDSSDLKYVYTGPYVNKRNASRFMSKELINSEMFKNGHYDHEYYVMKCRHLYYMIREKYTDYWWD